MAEERYVSQDQHRAELAELRREFKDETAGLRQDVAVLAKTVERLAQTMTTGFADLRQEMAQLRQDVRQDIREVRTTSQRQMWVILGAVIVALIKIAFFP